MPEYIHFRILWIWYYQKLQSTNLLRVSCFTKPTQRLTIYLATDRVWPTWNPKYYFCLHWFNAALQDHIYYSMKSGCRAFFLALVRKKKNNQTFYQLRWIQEVSIYNLFSQHLLFWERWVGKFWAVFISVFHIKFECIYLYSVSGLLNALGFHCLLAFYSLVIHILLKLLDCEIRCLLFLRQTRKTYFAHIICIIQKYVW